MDLSENRLACTLSRMHRPQNAPQELHTPQRLAVFGAYSDHDLYQRNRTLVALLKALSDESVDIRPPAGRAEHGLAQGQSVFQGLVRNLRDAWSLWTQRRVLDDCDTIFVPYPAYLGMLLLWLSGRLRERQVIADAFLEMYSTVVEDRGMLAHNSLGARLLLWFQRSSLGRANLVLIDTPAQAEQLRARLAGSDARVIDVPVGIDERIWHPLPLPPLGGPCRVLFWGTFIPLHGTHCIAAAARILADRGEPVEIHVIGDGQTAPEFAAELARHPVANLRWDRTLVDTDALLAAISAAHIVLGVFGDTAKAAAVVPYKVHQGLACNRPVISRQSPLMSAVADADAGLMLCEPGDPQALADAIAALHSRLHSGWRPQTRKVYEAHFATAVLRERLQQALSPAGKESPAC